MKMNFLKKGKTVLTVTVANWEVIRFGYRRWGKLRRAHEKGREHIRFVEFLENANCPIKDDI